MVPTIYEEVTGIPYNDGTIKKNKYFGAPEAKLLEDVCKELYKDETLLVGLQRALLDTEAKAQATSNKRNVIINMEKEIRKASYRDEDDAEQIAEARDNRLAGMIEEFDPEDLVD